MMKLPNNHGKTSLQRKLFKYMFILAVLLLTLLFAGLFLIGGFTGTKRRIANTLRFQCEVFERQISTHYDGLAVLSVQLSEATSELIDNYLRSQHMTFSDFNGSEADIHSLQKLMMEPLQRKLWEADCTGVFVMLDAQVNPASEKSSSRTGLYLQRSSLDAYDSQVLLYRGLSDVGKDNGCMPHRKWRLEFDTDNFPNYAELRAAAALPLRSAYRITDVSVLPGTDQRIMLMTIPIFGADGSFYGFCGFELNESYFRYRFAQPSELNHAIFCLGRKSETHRNADVLLTAGVTGLSFHRPTGYFDATDFGSGLRKWTGESETYIGLAQEVKLDPGDCSSTLSVLLSKSDYDRIAAEDEARAALLVGIFVATAAALSFFFMRRYLEPLRRSIQQLKAEQYSADETGIDEIDDLFVFFAEKQREKGELIASYDERHSMLQGQLDKLQDDYDRTSRELERVADKAQRELDQDSYAMFTEQLITLTAREREVFNLYMEGKNSKEIMEIMCISANGLKWHNKNIYAKLGVPSRKELLRYAAIMKQKERTGRV